MKKIYFLFYILVVISINLKAQTIACSEMCVLSISLDTVGPNELNVTIYNGINGSQINYPVVVVTDTNGDTILNKNNQFFYFAQILDDTLIHTFPTTLNTLATNFTGTVYIKDTPTGTICSYAYPMTCTVGINEYSQSGFSVYPNPATDNITIDLANFNNQNASIRIYDIAGKQVELLETTASKSVINIEYFNAGIYFVAVSVNSNKIFTRKLVVR